MNRPLTLKRTIPLLLLFFSLHAPECLEAQMTSSPRPTTLAGRSTVYAPNGAVATSQPLAT